MSRAILPVGIYRDRMNFGQRLMFPALKTDEGAKAIVDKFGRDLGAVYLPWW
jgi:hypothetical protein